MANYASMAGWGSAPSVNPYTGQPDYLAALSSNPEIAAALNNPAVSAAAAVPAAGSSAWGGISDWLDNSGVLGKKLADGTQIQGWGMPALGLASGLTNAYFGYQQLGVAKDSLEQQKKAFQLNFDAQKKTTNAALADRQNARVASNPGAYASTANYMKQYGI